VIGAHKGEGDAYEAATGSAAPIGATASPPRPCAPSPPQPPRWACWRQATSSTTRPRAACC
jgi:hypothetical protein